MEDLFKLLIVLVVFYGALHAALLWFIIQWLRARTSLARVLTAESVAKETVQQAQRSYLALQNTAFTANAGHDSLEQFAGLLAEDILSREDYDKSVGNSTDHRSAGLGIMRQKFPHEKEAELWLYLNAALRGGKARNG